MIQIGSSVEGGGATGLDLPLRSSVFRCPAAEGRVIGPPKVAGKPQKSCRFVEERSRSDFIITSEIYLSNYLRACPVLTTVYTSGLPSHTRTNYKH